MAPIKFEEHIKDKLEKRSLQPSQEAWNTLATRLEAQEKKNSNSLFWFIGIAASIVGILFVAFQFFELGTSDKNLPVIVDAPVHIESISKENKSTEDISNETIVANTDPEKINTNVASEISKEKKINNQPVNTSKQSTNN